MTNEALMFSPFELWKELNLLNGSQMTSAGFSHSKRRQVANNFSPVFF